MLVNFCDCRLRPEVDCSTVHTEGYEVTNLINDSSKGFLAYSCIRPPVNIDFTFVCNIRIHYVLIWPSVGSQKSSGFQLYAKTTNDHATPYTLLSSGNLGSTDMGLLFYSTRVDTNNIPVPANFVKRYIPASKDRLIACVQSLRLCIFKTENSVPALAKIEVWGTVSPNCGKDVMASVCALWTSVGESPLPLSSEIISASPKTNVRNVTRSRKKETIPLEIPENFLDAITFEIMTQPVILPSGKIIDQKTLEKHEGNEAVWGRALSDPFTGLTFTEERRPVIATALKMLIDKFLLENSNADEIKSIPRVLGRVTESAEIFNNEIVKCPTSSINKCTPHKLISTSETVTYRPVKDSNIKLKNLELKESSLGNSVGHCHRLPIIAISNAQSTKIVRPLKRKRTTTNIVPASGLKSESNIVPKAHCDNSTTDDNVECNLHSAVQDVLSSLKCFNSPKKSDTYHTPFMCNCCNSNILYRLPCDHVVCRKTLMAMENYKCQTCGKSWKSSEINRIHT